VRTNETIDKEVEDRINNMKQEDIENGNNDKIEEVCIYYLNYISITIIIKMYLNNKIISLTYMKTNVSGRCSPITNILQWGRLHYEICPKL
jgi:hypothetical protein